MAQTTGITLEINPSGTNRKEPFWNIKNITDTSADLYLYSPISSYGEAWGETSAKDVIKAVKDLGDIAQLNIYINSPGGVVTEGMAIKAFLARQPFKKNVYIDGLCASIATVIAFGIGATVRMESTALVMIHNAWTLAIGNCQELRKCADDLEKDDVNIKQTYLERTAGNLTEDEISEMMAAETWLNAQECLDYGFVDEIVSSSTQAVACLPQAYFNLYKNIPESLANQESKPIVEETPEPEVKISAESQAIIDKANSVLEKYHFRKEHDIHG